MGAITAAAAAVLLIGGWRSTGQPRGRADLAVLLGAVDARRYAVARASMLPRAIRERTRVVRRFGDAVIIERMAPTGHQP